MVNIIRKKNIDHIICKDGVISFPVKITITYNEELPYVSRAYLENKIEEAMSDMWKAPDRKTKKR